LSLFPIPAPLSLILATPFVPIRLYFCIQMIWYVYLSLQRQTKLKEQNKQQTKVKTLNVSAILNKSGKQSDHHEQSLADLNLICKWSVGVSGLVVRVSDS